MRISAISLLLLFIFFISLATPTVAGPKSSSSTSSSANKAELAKLRNVISDLQQELNAAQSSHDKMHNELRTHEKKIGAINTDLKKFNTQLKTHTLELRKQKKQEKKLRNDLYKHKDKLKQQIRTAYSIGNQDYLKLLLNQQNPATMGRVLSYYDYFIKVRAKNINTVKINIDAVKQIQNTIQANTEKLEILQQNRQLEIASLQQTKKERKQVLTRLGKEIQTKGRKLEKMRADEKRLQDLISTLRHALPDIPDQTENLINFARQKGQLRWPAKGKIRTRYGASRKMGKLKWQGVIIGANEGDEVKAISQGQVAFADWLQGYGLLVIIDHGDNFMSLYGFNQSLYKEPGDWIEAGETIATVGNSGGQTKSGLYFEIRRNGKPTNPSIWCSNKPNKKSARR